MESFWQDFTSRLASAGPRMIAKTWFPDDAHSRMEAYYQLVSGIVYGYITEVYTDLDYPEFSPHINTAVNIAAPVPDYLYFSTPVNGDGIYRIFGFRGSARFAEIGMFRDLSRMAAAGKQTRSAGQIDLDELGVGADGGFSVMLSAERPTGHDGDWVHLGPIVNMLLARCASYDWLNEVDPRIGIERLDVPAVKARLSAAELERRLTGLPAFAEEAVTRWLDHTGRQRIEAENRLQRQDFMAVDGLPGQDYFEGVYNLAEGEGLLVETNVPSACRFWSILVTDDKWATVDDRASHGPARRDESSARSMAPRHRSA